MERAGHRRRRLRAEGSEQVTSKDIASMKRTRRAPSVRATAAAGRCREPQELQQTNAEDGERPQRSSGLGRTRLQGKLRKVSREIKHRILPASCKQRGGARFSNPGLPVEKQRLREIILPTCGLPSVARPVINADYLFCMRHRFVSWGSSLARSCVKNAHERTPPPPERGQELACLCIMRALEGAGEGCRAA